MASSRPARSLAPHSLPPPAPSELVPKFLDLFLKLSDFVSDLAMKFPDLVPKFLDLIWKRRMAYHVSSPWLNG